MLEGNAMLFLWPFEILALIYLGAALVPGFFLLRYVYNLDKVEKEDPQLLGSLVVQGVKAALLSILLEFVGSIVLDVGISRESPMYTLLSAFFVVAAVEEGTKFFFLKKRTWYIPDFNFRFDGIVYACFTSMGFAMFENVKYVFSYGLQVALPRAILAVPGHLGFSVFMGVFYGLAKHYDIRGRKVAQGICLFFAWFSAMLLHGIYDFCLMRETGETMLVFLLFVVAMYIVVITLLKKTSAHDKPVWA